MNKRVQLNSEGLPFKILLVGQQNELKFYWNFIKKRIVPNQGSQLPNFLSGSIVLGCDKKKLMKLK